MTTDNPTLDAVLEGMARDDAESVCKRWGFSPLIAQEWADFKPALIEDARAVLFSEPLASLLKRAVEALGPFAKCAPKYSAAQGGIDDSLVVSTGWLDKALDSTAGDFRAAASVLSDLKALTAGVGG